MSKIALLTIVLVSVTRMAQAQTFTDSTTLGTHSGQSLNSATALTDTLSLSSGFSTNVFSQPPLLSRRYTVDGTTLMPYIGAGFGSGQPSDLQGTVFQQERILRGPLGSTAVPNEVQVGVRIPF